MQIGILECNQFSEKAIATLELAGKVELFDEKKSNLSELSKTTNFLETIVDKLSEE